MKNTQSRVGTSDLLGGVMDIKGVATKGFIIQVKINDLTKAYTSEFVFGGTSSSKREIARAKKLAANYIQSELENNE